MATLTKRSRSELEALKQQHREIIERVVASYRSVLEHIDPDGSAAAKERGPRSRPPARRWRPRAGFGAQYSDINKVTAHHGDNHVPLVARGRPALPQRPGGDAGHGQRAGAFRPPAPTPACWTSWATCASNVALTRDHIPDHVPLADADGNPVPGENGKPGTRVFDTSLGTQQSPSSAVDECCVPNAMGLPRCKRRLQARSWLLPTSCCRLRHLPTAGMGLVCFRPCIGQGVLALPPMRARSRPKQDAL